MTMEYKEGGPEKQPCITVYEPFIFYKGSGKGGEKGRQVGLFASQAEFLADVVPVDFNSGHRYVHEIGNFFTRSALFDHSGHLQLPRRQFQVL